MKNLLVFFFLCIFLCSCGEGVLGYKKERSVLIGTKIMDKNVDLRSIHYSAYRNDTQKPLGLDSIGQEGFSKNLDKPFPQSLGVFGLRFDDKIKAAPKGYYVVEAKFGNGAFVRKQFGEIKGEESHLNFECLISGDSTVEAHPK